jgi:hypothetical protein
VRKIAMSGLVALAAVLGGAIPASAAAAAPGAAVQAPGTAAASAAVLPRAATATAFLIGGSTVSCGSVKACLAVGANTNNTSGIPAPVAEAWNGTKWKSVAVHAPKGPSGASLTGVSCKSAASCVAVGEYSTSAGNRPFALTWNGTALTPAAAPPVPKSDTFFSLSSVSCVTTRNCVAVGMSAGGTGSTHVLVETWNGAKWTDHVLPASSSVLMNFNSVSCVSATRCVVAGESDTFTGSNVTFGVLLALWNGKTLTAMKAPLPAGTGAGTPLITDVSCASAASCVAVGAVLSGSGTSGFGFTETWNGKAWTAAKVASPKGITLSFLFGVSCPTAHNCVAVGAAGTSKSGSATAMSYNGKAWSRQAVPAPGKGKSDAFEGVSCLSAANCVAIGATGATGATNSSNLSPLSGIWNGKAWRLVPA